MFGIEAPRRMGEFHLHSFYVAIRSLQPSPINRARGRPKAQPPNIGKGPMGVRWGPSATHLRARDRGQRPMSDMVTPIRKMPEPCKIWACVGEAISWV